MKTISVGQIIIVSHNEISIDVIDQVYKVQKTVLPVYLKTEYK